MFRGQILHNCKWLHGNVGLFLIRGTLTEQTSQMATGNRLCKFFGTMRVATFLRILIVSLLVLSIIALCRDFFHQPFSTSDTFDNTLSQRETDLGHVLFPGDRLMFEYRSKFPLDVVFRGHWGDEPVICDMRFSATSNKFQKVDIPFAEFLRCQNLISTARQTRMPVVLTQIKMRRADASLRGIAVRTKLAV